MAKLTKLIATLFHKAPTIDPIRASVVVAGQRAEASANRLRSTIADMLSEADEIKVARK